MRKLLRSIFVGAFCAIFALPALADGPIINGTLINAETKKPIVTDGLPISVYDYKTGKTLRQAKVNSNGNFELIASELTDSSRVRVSVDGYEQKQGIAPTDNMTIELKPKKESSTLLQQVTVTENRIPVYQPEPYVPRIDPNIIPAQNAPTGPALLSGTLINGDTGKPFSSNEYVQVISNGKTLDNKRAQVNPRDGSFLLENIPSGSQIKIEKDGYFAQTVTPTDYMTVVLYSIPTGIVTNTKTKQPISNVTVRATGVTGGTITETTDTNGQFVLSSAIPNDAILSFSATGYQEQQVRYSKNMRVELTASADLPLDISGIVVNTDNQPLCGAKIFAIDRDNSSNILGRAITFCEGANEGTFTLQNIPRSAKLSVTLLEYRDKTIDHVEPNMTIVLEPKELKTVCVENYSGTVIDGLNGAPISNVQVIAVIDSQGTPAPGVEPTYTSAQGGFGLYPKQFPKDTKLMFSHDGYRPRILNYKPCMQVTLYTDEQLAYMPGQTITFPGEPITLTGPNVPVPTLADPYATASITTIYHSKPNVFNELDSILTNKFQGSSVWKNEEGKFNTARLASDSIAGVVLGTVGGVVTSTVIKKNQLKKGFEDLKCTIGGQDVASFGDEFSVTVRK